MFFSSILTENEDPSILESKIQKEFSDKDKEFLGEVVSMVIVLLNEFYEYEIKPISEAVRQLRPSIPKELLSF